MASKLCDSCKSATATLYCRSDVAYLCGACDSKVHDANKLASRHPRVPLCQVCEQAPAHVTCQADAAALCIVCDHDIHAANPLASRHQRLPVTPFFESVHYVEASLPINLLDADRFYSNADADVSTEEAEARSWLLPDHKTDLNSSQYLFSDTEPVPFIDLDYAAVDPKAEQKSSATAEGIVPVQSNFEPFAYGFKYNTTLSQSQSQLSQSVSSSSMEVGAVPDGNTMPEISNCSYRKVPPVTVTAQFSAAERVARVLRYREKRKNRSYEKMVRYKSRKAYAETRPRIKGRFAKRTDADPLAGYGVVPSC